MNAQRMQLSEADAYQILKTHCIVLHGRLVFLQREQHGAYAVRRRMAVECLQLTDSQVRQGVKGVKDVGLGVRLRVTLDIVNAMCSCPGLEPHVNLRFWRHAVCSLWIKYPVESETRLPVAVRDVFAPEPCEFLPFHSSAFSYFSICVYDSELTGLSGRVCLLWQQLAGVGSDGTGNKRPSAASRVRSVSCSEKARPLCLTLCLPATHTWAPFVRQLNSCLPIHWANPCETVSE